MISEGYRPIIEVSGRALASRNLKLILYVDKFFSKEHEAYSWAKDCYLNLKLTKTGQTILILYDGKNKKVDQIKENQICKYELFHEETLKSYSLGVISELDDHLELKMERIKIKKLSFNETLKSRGKNT